MKEFKNLKIEGMEELALNEVQEIEGGFIALIFSGIGLCIAAYGVGLATGRAIF